MQLLDDVAGLQLREELRSSGFERLLDQVKVQIVDESGRVLMEESKR